jgi:acetyl-CoA C-acetyltransferase
LSEVVILSAVRTPYGRLLGSLADLAPVTLGARAVTAAMERAGVRPSDVERAFLGNVSAHALRGNPAAAVAREVGLPTSTPAVTHRAGCASSLVAIVSAIESILSGGCAVAVAGGFESASAAPHLATGLRRGLRLGPGSLLDAARHDGPEGFPVGGETDAPALLGFLQDSLAGSIVPVDPPATRRGATRPVDRDDAAAGKPAAAGTANPSGEPPLADGAAAMVLASSSWSRDRGLRPLATVRAAAHPLAAVISGARIIEADLSAKEAEALERELPRGTAGIVNVAGGGAILGHATGADGARLVVNLLPLLMRAGGGRGVALASGGWGQPAGIVVEI